MVVVHLEVVEDLGGVVTVLREAVIEADSEDEAEVDMHHIEQCHCRQPERGQRENEHRQTSCVGMLS